MIDPKQERKKREREVKWMMILMWVLGFICGFLWCLIEMGTL